MTKKIILDKTRLKNEPRFSKKYGGYSKVYFNIDESEIPPNSEFNIKNEKQLTYDNGSYIPKNSIIDYELRKRKNSQLELILNLIYNEKAPIYENDLIFFYYI